MVDLETKGELQLANGNYTVEMNVADTWSGCIYEGRKVIRRLK